MITLNPANDATERLSMNPVWGLLLLTALTPAYYFYSASAAFDLNY